MFQNQIWFVLSFKKSFILHFVDYSMGWVDVILHGLMIKYEKSFVRKWPSSSFLPFVRIVDLSSFWTNGDTLAKYVYTYESQRG